MMALASVVAVIGLVILVDQPANAAAPVVAALRAIDRVAAASASSTTVDDTDPTVQYSGPWQTSTGPAKSGGSDHYTDQQGASASLIFTGSSIALYGAQAPWHGDLSVSVDGGASVGVSTYAATRSDNVQLFQQNLGAGPHLIVITAAGTGAHGHVIAVDRFVYGATAPTTTSSTSTTTAATATTTSTATTATSPTATTPVDDTDAAFSYDSQWSTSQGPAKTSGDDHYASAAGATATLKFNGTGAALLGATASWYGLASFTVDGGPASTVDLYSAARVDQQPVFTVHGLPAGSHVVRASATGTHNSASSGTVISIDGARIDNAAISPTTAAQPTTSPPTTTAPVTTTPPTTAAPITSTVLPTPPALAPVTTASATTAAPSTTPAPAPAAPAWVTRSGSQLKLNGATFRFAGANEYWLGLDDNIRDASGVPTHPSHARIDSGLTAAAATGLTVIRSHSMGISVGCQVCVEPSLGVFNDSAFDSADYALYRTGQLGLKLIIPLTDQWRYYHGGISTFTAWRGYPDDSNMSVTAANSSQERAAESNFYTDPTVVGDFQTYIAHLLNHVNPYTGLAWKNDPTVMAWETGNELWTANPSWTETIASFIKKTVGARALVADGSGADGMHVANAAIDAPDVDMLSGHFYPVDVGWMVGDAATAAAHGKVYFVGEYAWTDLTASALMMAAAQALPAVSGDLVWSMLPYQEDGTPEPHGDGYALYNPGTTGPMQTYLALLGVHAKAMSAH